MRKNDKLYVKSFVDFTFEQELAKTMYIQIKEGMS